ncbi:MULTISPECIES: tRNA (adenosine(37)-N6)-threonylcarbamoyltransferase complex dimerization subunit type 1 TsaB [Lacrimispora]|jgi:tRNA threonylcarbamoyladenosine biosynthesis protein TsaB|uniref:tRNA (adenosine(37)-N6)-threonylcarbamoyltransferase complex dimerization subunit type 1 TsaB n=1 Tax=Lacrimispora TaxID=2719231 RepID=UPI000BE37792|nr:tRNA (adenosine(37)-N6)-threonylcarbamoyltransferase complex dimerization subunit type 1 TsaB [Lacrimispora amygdalina]MDK2968235.1 tRNA threonylcarbamoyladenosine biosynthesis protein TsaB [Lacrimispora sp.]
MNLLGIESSSLVASVALLTDDILTAEYTVNFKKTHSQTLLPMLDEIVTMTGIRLEDIDAIAVSAGPGSFTGLRIGSATGKGLGLALKKPLVSVPTIDAMAFEFYGSASIICPIMDARRNQVYTGIYDNRKGFSVIKESCAMDIRELIEELNSMGQSVIFSGDGVPVCKESIEEFMKVPFEFAPAHLNRQRAGAVAAYGARLFSQGKTVTAAEHAPDYLRKPQAEREREEALKGE